MAVIDDFKKCDTPCIFFISLKAGGVGLNLTEAGYVFLLDPWWNPAVENQAIDRCYRIGQDNPVTVYRFITWKMSLPMIRRIVFLFFDRSRSF